MLWGGVGWGEGGEGEGDNYPELPYTCVLACLKVSTYTEILQEIAKQLIFVKFHKHHVNMTYKVRI